MMTRGIRGIGRQAQAENRLPGISQIKGDLQKVFFSKLRKLGLDSSSWLCGDDKASFSLFFPFFSLTKDESYRACLSPSGQMCWKAEMATEVVAGGKGEGEP